jgi:hypothetical protein
VKNIATALIKFQAACPPIGKHTRGHGYVYAPYEDCWRVVRPHMTDAGLCITHTSTVSDPGVLALRSILIHVSGEIIDSMMSVEVPPMPGKERGVDMHAHGSALTYLKRYNLLALLGITAGGDDDDGQVAVDAAAKVRGAADRALSALENELSAAHKITGRSEGDILAEATRGHLTLEMMTSASTAALTKARDNVRNILNNAKEGQ